MVDLSHSVPGSQDSKDDPRLSAEFRYHPSGFESQKSEWTAQHEKLQISPVCTQWLTLPGQPSSKQGYQSESSAKPNHQLKRDVHQSYTLPIVFREVVDGNDRRI